jgi:SAM-dependent methyltransferase
MNQYKAIADFYDAEYADSPMLQRDVPFFLRSLGKRPRSVLELASGTGRAAIPIAQAGHRVVGVDIDADMVERARQKRDGCGLTKRRLELMTGDAMSLRLARKFDWVAILFNTFFNFATLDQQDRVLATIRHHLKPKGRVYLDVFFPNIELLSQGRSVHHSPMVFYVPEHKRTVYRDVEIVRNLRDSTQKVMFHYRWFENDGRERKKRVQFMMTWMWPREMALLLNRHGFEIEEMFGDYDGSPVTSDSTRMITVARRTRRAEAG